MPIILPPAAPSGVLRYAWVDSQGVVHDLSWMSSPNLFVTRGARGLGTPGVELATEKLPTAGGSLLRYTQTKPLEISLPLLVQAATFAGLLATVDSLRGWFDTGNETVRTPGYLQVTRPQDNALRQIACYYAGGLEGDLSDGTPTAAPLVVDLMAPDPYWTDLDTTIALYGTADVGHDRSVINVGDFDAYPIWTINGPAGSIVLTNTTSGKTLALTVGGLVMATGETLTIDTRPASQRTTLPVMDDEGTTHFSSLQAGSALWWLKPGQNHLTISASGTTGATSFELAWLPRYRGVLR